MVLLNTKNINKERGKIENIKTLIKRSPEELYKRIINYDNYFNYGNTFYTNSCVNLDKELYTIDELCNAFLNSNLANLRRRKEKQGIVLYILNNI